MSRIIFHIDVNSAYLSWEAVYRLSLPGETVDLRTIPSAVGGDVNTRHGIILAKSIPAKQFHIKTGEPVTDALKKCPTLTLVPPNRALYKKNSKALMDLLQEYSPVVEQYSIDEAFVDMTGTELLHGDPIETAHTIKNRIRDEMGFTVNVGISSNKLLAKMASDFEKPDRVHTLFPDEISQKMWGLPVRDLFLVGKSSEKKLLNLGIHTIGELAASDPELLRRHLKKHGESIWRFANGYDVSDVLESPEPNKGYGNSTTLAANITEDTAAKKVLLSLAESVSQRLRADHVQIQNVSVSIRFHDLTRISHQKMLSEPSNTVQDIYRTACELFDEMWDSTPIRLLGIQTGKVIEQDSYQQLSLFDLPQKSEKQKKLDHALDSIRERYGKDAIKRASFLK